MSKKMALIPPISLIPPTWLLLGLGQKTAPKSIVLPNPYFFAKIYF